jgi:NAD(P)H-hydrate epimerase
VIIEMAKSKVEVTSVDAPSSWNIESGPPKEGPGSDFNPQALVSLTAPKPLVKWFRGRHFLGGRFVPPDVAQKYDIVIPEYPGIDQVVELDGNLEKL